MSNDKNKTTKNIQLHLTSNPNELDRWLDETSVPLSDDDMKAMYEYFKSENFQYEESALFDTINS